VKPFLNETTMRTAGHRIGVYPKAILVHPLLLLEFTCYRIPDTGAADMEHKYEVDNTLM
jgi:hypothetical protein